MKLPDMRGKFLRGSDLGASVDPEAANRGDHGTNQGDLVENHFHFIIEDIASPNDLSYATDNTAGGAGPGIQGGTSDRLYAYTESPSDPLGDETRPINVNAGWYIWY